MCDTAYNADISLIIDTGHIITPCSLQRPVSAGVGKNDGAVLLPEYTYNISVLNKIVRLKAEIIRFNR